MKKGLLAAIEREIALHSDDSPGLIRFKTNALEDADVVEALYRASQAGVRVELVVRDTCRLRPGVPGVSDNVTVVSIVGRFLEHSRIYYFRNGGEGDYYIGSADLMRRNLRARVEVLVPVTDPAHRAQLHQILESQIHDNRSGWDMKPDGTYVQRQPRPGQIDISAQESLILAATARETEANRLRKRKLRAIAHRISR